MLMISVGRMAFTSREATLNSEGRMPAGVCPKLPADFRVADQEADRLGDFGRLD